MEKNNPVVICRKISHKNHYDYTKHHRHDYFEIILFLEGGGTQLVDFIDYKVESNTCYLIYPQQIHLLNRAPGSHGVLIQFKEGVLFSRKLQKLLKQRRHLNQNTVIFKNNKGKSNKVLMLFDMINSLDTNSIHSTDTNLHLLHALLFELISLQDTSENNESIDSDYYTFLAILEHKFKSEQKVSFYLSKLEIGEKKLSSLCKNHQGLTPLQVIHQRILLEAKRLLVFEDKSHKEIAYELGFDSPSSFSSFIKKKTGLTATELSESLN